MDKKRLRNDLLLALALAAVCLALFALRGCTREAGALVRVTVDGEIRAELPLGEDTRLVIGEGGRTNTLVIASGAAWIEQASCPDLICVHEGRIRYSGQSIVCLPNRLIVTVEGGADSGVDAVAG